VMADEDGPRSGLKEKVRPQPMHDPVAI